MRLTTRALALALLLASGCAPAPRPSPLPPPTPVEVTAPESVVIDRLYLGRNMRGGGTVSERQWAIFLRDVVSEAFPEGLTFYRADGQWRDEETGVIGRERTFVLEIVHPPTPAAEEKIIAIADEYRRRFHQSAVMRVTASGTRQFIQ